MNLEKQTLSAIKSIEEAQKAFTGWDFPHSFDEADGYEGDVFDSIDCLPDDASDELKELATAHDDSVKEIASLCAAHADDAIDYLRGYYFQDALKSIKKAVGIEKLCGGSAPAYQPALDSVEGLVESLIESIDES